MVLASSTSHAARPTSDTSIPHRIAGPANDLPTDSLDSSVSDSSCIENSVSAASFCLLRGVSPLQSENKIPQRMAGPASIGLSYNTCT